MNRSINVLCMLLVAFLCSCATSASRMVGESIPLELHEKPPEFHRAIGVVAVASEEFDRHSFANPEPPPEIQEKSPEFLKTIGVTAVAVEDFDLLNDGKTYPHLKVSFTSSEHFDASGMQALIILLDSDNEERLAIAYPFSPSSHTTEYIVPKNHSLLVIIDPIDASVAYTVRFSY